ncbi:maltose excess protein 1, chloroplastic-like, partial [Cannabis sativa]|uniref:maltose excess protein 1, chloroplastic-like n=1 Tax=Cannabis sativa TaxID=3483 RepID=UPI0029CA9FBA
THLSSLSSLCSFQLRFLGSSWASFFYGYGNLACLYWFNSISKEFFLAATAGFVLWIVLVVTGLAVNFFNYFYLLNDSVWRFWEDVITVGGLSALPQVMWSTFVPYLPNTILPGALSFVVAVAAVVMARLGKLSEKGTKFVGAISGWTATLLFMWMPVSQMWTNFLNPDNIKGLSPVSMLLAMIGNGLMIPRALLTRDFMWFLGSSWASFFYGYGNLACLYWFNSISKEFFLAATAGFELWIGMALWRDTVVHGYSSPFTSLKELISGS